MFQHHKFFRILLLSKVTAQRPTGGATTEGRQTCCRRRRRVTMVTVVNPNCSKNKRWGPCSAGANPDSITKGTVGIASITSTTAGSLLDLWEGKSKLSLDLKFFFF